MSRSAFVLAFLVAGATGCQTPRGTEADGRFLNLDPEVAYVGDAVCATCHEDLYTSYQGHGMAQSFYRLTAETAVESFDGAEVRHAASGFVYVARRVGERFVQEEYREAPDGTRTHELVRTMDYVVGSGTAARTYLTEENGRLYQLPLTWYTRPAGPDSTAAGGVWGLSPGFEEVNSRFDRTIPDRCMACHNGTSPPVPFADGKFASLASGIGCEQCHGPGELHVEARLGGSEAETDVDPTIVNPAHLGLDLQLDVCQQCHLNGDVSVLREGETATSYRPGRPLSAHRAIFAAEAEDPNRVSVISHADRMKQSACFIESKTMTCVTCHNPHEGFREKGPDYFNVTCRSCHASEDLRTSMPTPALAASHLPEANCFSCHMPKVAADDVPHASFTDHNIRVVSDDRIEGTSTGGRLRPYDEADAGSVYEGMAYVIYARSGGGASSFRRGVDLLGEAVEERPEAGEAQYLLGYARLQMGQPERAIEPLEAAMAVGENPERLNTLAQAYEQAGRPPAEAERLYRRALDLQPAAARVRTNLGRLLEARGDLDGAISAYERAIEEEPWLAAAWTLLGGARAKSGDSGGAVEALQEAVRLEPEEADALTNLGVLLAQGGRVAEAGRLFERAARAEPGNASARANYALFLLNEGQFQAALENAQAALQIDPGQSTAMQVLQALQAGA